MKLLGISGSPRQGKTTDRLVQAVLAGAAADSEFVSLAKLKIGPCRACLACVEDNVCKVRDDMVDLREKILAADGLVIGAPNYFSLLNGITHCFLERLCQFRHRSCMSLANKTVAVVSTGGLEPAIPAGNIERILGYYGMRHAGTVIAQGPASCFTCGHGESCETGAVHMLFGPGVAITEEMIPDQSRDFNKLEEARQLGRSLAALSQ